MTLTHFFESTLRYHTDSLPYDLGNIRSHDTLFMELDFHQPRIVCGHTTSPLYELFDTDYLALTLDFTTRMQDTLLDALESSSILTATDQAFLTMEIHKNKYALHCVMNGHRMYIKPGHLE